MTESTTLCFPDFELRDMMKRLCVLPVDDIDEPEIGSELLSPVPLLEANLVPLSNPADFAVLGTGGKGGAGSKAGDVAKAGGGGKAGGVAKPGGGMLVPLAFPAPLLPAALPVSGSTVTSAPALPRLDAIEYRGGAGPVGFALALAAASGSCWN